jgi:hypothetical protein
MNTLKTYVCESCFHIQKRYRRSKCEECKGKTFVCDEWIAPTIQLLNRKGYRTKYCCSGHITSIPWTGTRTLTDEKIEMNFYHCWGCYVFFDMKAKDLLKMKLPEGYELDESVDRRRKPRTIRYSDQFKPGNYAEAISHLQTSMTTLYEWAKELPSRTSQASG